MLHGNRREVLLYTQDYLEPMKIYETGDELVHQRLQPNYHLHIDIESVDMWLKCYLFMDAINLFSYAVEFEIKIEQRILGKELKNLLMYMSISIWNKLCKES